MRTELTNVIFRNLGFIVFLTLLGVLYIFNQHKAEKKMREIEVLKREVSDAKHQYHKIKNEIMYHSTESQLAKDLKKENLKSNDDPPVVIKKTSERS